nr:DUF2255 family protein [uncultured Rhodopila sp.]
MTVWTGDELDRVGGADELRIASLRQDGTLRKPVTIWVVRVGDDLYVRSAYGDSPAWLRGTRVRHEGRISAGGIEKDVAFVAADTEAADAIDAAYWEKYRRDGEQYVASVVTPEARATTIRLVPR